MEYCIHGCGKIAIRHTKKKDEPVCFSKNAMQCPVVAAEMAATRNKIDPVTGRSEYQVTNKKTAENLGSDWFRDRKIKQIEEQRNTIFEDGKNGLQKQAEKAMHTMRSSIDESGFNGLKRRADKIAENKGEEGHKSGAKKQKRSMLKIDGNGLNGYERTVQTKRDKGILIPLENKSDWEVYRNAVNKLTNKSFNDYYWEINPNNIKRGKEYHLDHIYSVYDGFINGISIEIISSWINLRLIDCKKNIGKGKNSDISLGELVESYMKRI